MEIGEEKIVKHHEQSANEHTFVLADSEVVNVESRNLFRISCLKSNCKLKRMTTSVYIVS